MEAYPSEYVEHNLPLVVLSGLGEQHDVSTAANAVPRQEGGTRLQIQSPECSGEQAQQVLQQFRQYDGSNQPWNASALPGPSDPLMYRTKATGRVGTARATRINTCILVDVSIRPTLFHHGKPRHYRNQHHLMDSRTSMAVRRALNFIRLCHLFLLVLQSSQMGSLLPYGSQSNRNSYLQCS